jgi:LuxR family maltose regulon positive regulatory protein
MQSLRPAAWLSLEETDNHPARFLTYQSTSMSTGGEKESLAELHERASRWFEANGLEVEAVQHAAAANDIERAECLIEGEGVPLYFRGTVVPVLKWLESLPRTVLDARPSLW